MKKLLLIVALVGWSASVMCQTDEERDAEVISKAVQYQQALQNDGPYKWVTGEDYEQLYGPRIHVDRNALYKAINEQLQKNEHVARQNAQHSQSHHTEQNTTQQPARGGVSFDVDNSSGRNQNAAAANRRRQQEQLKKARRDAEHQAWLAERRAKQAEAARRERLRKEQERQRRYNEALARGYKQNANNYAKLNRTVDYTATVGYDRMLNTQPKGTERIHSGYVPKGGGMDSQTALAALSPKASGRRAIHLINGNETSNAGTSMAYQDYYEWLNSMGVSDDSKSKLGTIEPSPSIIDGDYKTMEDVLDGCQIAAVEYFIKENNHGKMPKMVGITESGRYVFESDDGQRVFSVSPNGVLIIATFDEKDWKDENIIAKIYNGEFLKDLKDEASFTWKGGSIKFKDLKNFDENTLRKLLPQLKAQMKLTIVDNSSTLKGKAYYLEPQDPIQQYFTEKTGVPFSVNSVYGVGVSVSAGGEVKMSGEANATPVILQDTSPLFLKASVKASEMEATGEVTAARVIRMGNRYFLVSGNIEGELGIGYTFEQGIKVGGGTDEIKMKSALFPLPIYAGTKIGGTLFKDITPKRHKFHGMQNNKE